MRSSWLLFSIFAMTIAPGEDEQDNDRDQKIEEPGDCGKEVPFDIIIEILARLPIKSLLRCKCVCKLWCAQIQERYFVDRHMSSSKANIVYKGKAEVRKELETVVRFDSVDGLLVEKNKLTKTYLIRNPATQQMLQLPGPYKLIENMRLLYLPTTNKYKLVRVYCKDGKDNGGCEVLDFGTDLRWRYIDIPCFYNLGRVGDKILTRSIDEVFFVAKISLAGGSDESWIFYLEMESEHFGKIEIPNAFFKGLTKVFLSIWEDKLALAGVVVGFEGHFWILEDYLTGRWNERKIVIPLTFLDKNFPHIVSRELSFDSFHEGWLLIHLGDGYIWYNMKSKQICASSPPPGESYLYSYIPSLVSLPGFGPQDRK